MGCKSCILRSFPKRKYAPVSDFPYLSSLSVCRTTLLQVNQARRETERMRESLVRQQHEIAALQDFIDKHNMRQQDDRHVDGFLEVCL
jgi:hypothetical protein